MFLVLQDPTRRQWINSKCRVVVVLPNSKCRVVVVLPNSKCRVVVVLPMGQAFASYKSEVTGNNRFAEILRTPGWGLHHEVYTQTELRCMLDKQL